MTRFKQRSTLYEMKLHIGASKRILELKSIPNEEGQYSKFAPFQY